MDRSADESPNEKHIQNGTGSKDAEARSRPVTRSSTGSLPPRKDVGSNGQAAIGSVQDNGEYEVEKIVAKCVDIDSGELHYCVKWLGYADKENTWEPLCNLVNCPEMVEEFEEKAKALQEKESKL